MINPVGVAYSKEAIGVILTRNMGLKSLGKIPRLFACLFFRIRAVFVCIGIAVSDHG